MLDKLDSTSTFLIVREQIGDDLINWNQLQMDVLQFVTFIYILAEKEKREEICNNISEIFEIQNVNEELCNRIKEIDTKNLMQNILNHTFVTIKNVIKDSIDEGTEELVNIKGYTIFHLIKLCIISIAFREDCINTSLYFILALAVFEAVEQKFQIAGYTDKSPFIHMLTLPKLCEVMKDKECCRTDKYQEISESIDKKGDKIFRIIQNEVMQETIENLY